MKIQVNGEPRTMAAAITVEGLLHDLQIRPDRVAVEVNMEIVDRQDFARCALQEGDKVEVIGFIGGGRAISLKLGRMFMKCKSPRSLFS